MTSEEFAKMESESDYRNYDWSFFARDVDSDVIKTFDQLVEEMKPLNYKFNGILS